MKRAALIALITTFGFTLTGCIAGGALGFIAPGFYRRMFGAGGDDAFQAVEIGMGSGAMLGFLAGAAVIAVRMAASVLPGLARQRLFGRGSSQLTFGGLLFAVAILALGFASLKHPSRAVAQLWFSLTALALASATLIALSRPIERRGFAAGFGVLGWSYLLLSVFPESRAQLPTSDLLPALEKHISGSWRMGVQILSLETGPFPARQRGTYWEPVLTSLSGIPGTLQIDEVQPEFRRIGHSLFALLLGVVGGVIGDFRLARHRIGTERGDRLSVTGRLDLKSR
jgi:hypothetical protein